MPILSTFLALQLNTTINLMIISSSTISTIKNWLGQDLQVSMVQILHVQSHSMEGPQ
jgi:hypothetical protein